LKNTTKEHQRDAERDLGGDAEAEPQEEDRRQDDPGQRVEDADIGVEHRGDQLDAREGEAENYAGERADGEGEKRLDQRRCEMLPDEAGDEPVPDAQHDVAGPAEEERI
jgi:hypothetical protein